MESMLKYNLFMYAVRSLRPSKYSYFVSQNGPTKNGSGWGSGGIAFKTQITRGIITFDAYFEIFVFSSSFQY